MLLRISTKVSADTVTSKFLLWTPTKSSGRKWNGNNSLGCAVNQHWHSSTGIIIIIKNHITKYCIFKIPSDINGPTKEFEDLPIYKDLEIEVSRMWDMKTITMKRRNKRKLVWTPTKNSARKWLGNNPLEYANHQWQISQTLQLDRHYHFIIFSSFFFSSSYLAPNFIKF